MPCTAKKVIEIARGELGYHEKQTNAQLDDKTANSGNKNFTKYARDMHKAGYYNGNKNGYAWCCVSIDWDFWIGCDKDKEKAMAMQYQTGNLGAGCVYAAQYYRKAGQWYDKPIFGDRIFFGPPGDEEHTGLVVEVTDKRVKCIEGNADNQVAERWYDLDDPWITGYGRPNYDPEPEPEVPEAQKTDGRFHSLDDCPGYARTTIAKLMENGLLLGKGNGDLDLSEDMLRLLVILDRAGLFQ